MRDCPAHGAEKSSYTQKIPTVVFSAAGIFLQNGIPLQAGQGAYGMETVCQPGTMGKGGRADKHTLAHTRRNCKYSIGWRARRQSVTSELMWKAKHGQLAMKGRLEPFMGEPVEKDKE